MLMFDAYRASIPASVQLIKRDLAQFINAQGGGTDKPHANYKHAMRYDCLEGTVRLSWGGQNPLPFIDTQGPPSDDVAYFLRECHSEHTCGRADVCADFTGGREKFEEVSSILNEIALRRGVQTQLLQSPTDPEKGRTLYLGSRTSEVCLRLYEKAKQLKEVKGITIADQGLLRLEFEVKPKNRKRKMQLAKTPIDDIPCFAKWGAETVQSVFDRVATFIPREKSVKASEIEAVRYMLKQYGPTMARVAKRYGKKTLFALLQDGYRQAIEDAKEL